MPDPSDPLTPTAPVTNPSGGPSDALATTMAFMAGLDALHAGNATTALACFSESLAIDPDQPEALYHRAVALLQLRRYNESLEQAQRALALNPEHAGAKQLVERLGDPGFVAPVKQLSSVLATEQEWKLGDVVEGRWEVFGSASGGMGRVYFVRDRDWDGLELAVKTLTLAPNAPQTEVERVRALFRRETQVWLDLGAHPHIVSGYYTLEVAGALRFFMEYVPGMSLESVARFAKKQLPIAHALDLLIQLAAGVEYVHARGAVHRDLKPANCLVMEDGSLRVTDFGLSKIGSEPENARYASTKDPSDTMPSVIGALSISGAGTPWYMAPEQWRSLAHAGPPADVYAFGVILYELIAGSFPFDVDPGIVQRYQGRLPQRLERVLRGGHVSRELILWLMHLEVEPLPLRVLRAANVSFAGALGVNEATETLLEELATQCLAKDPSLRPSMAELGERLRRAFVLATEQGYPREIPGPLSPTSSGENNRAVSYFVMGDTKRAQNILDEWLSKAPLAPYAWLNRKIIDVKTNQLSLQNLALRYGQELVTAHPQVTTQDTQVVAIGEKLRQIAPWWASATHAVAASYSGKFIAMGVGEQLVLADRLTGRALRTFVGHKAGITAVAWAVDDAWIVTGSYDKTARVWSTQTGEVLFVLHGHTDCVQCIDVSSNQHWIATGAGSTHAETDWSAKVWDAKTGECVLTVHGHRAEITAVAISENEHYLATASRDGTVALWDFVDGSLVYVFTDDVEVARWWEESYEPTLAAVSVPYGVWIDFDRENTLVIARSDGRISRWSTESATSIVNYTGATSTITACAMSWDCACIAAWEPMAHTGPVHHDPKGKLWVWDRSSGRQLQCISTDVGHVHALSFVRESQGYGVIAATEQGTVQWFSDGHSLSIPLLIETPASARTVLHRERERTALLARFDALDVTAYQPLQKLRDRIPEYQRDENLVHTIHRTAQKIAITKGLFDAWVIRTLALNGGVSWVTFTANGQRICVAQGDEGGKIAVVWNHLTGESEPVTWPETKTAIASAAAFDGKFFLAAQENGALFLVRTGSRSVRRFQSEAEGNTSVAITPDGTVAATGQRSGTISLWLLEKGKKIALLRGHRHEVSALAFSPDGQWLASGGWDRTVRIWHLESNQCVLTLYGHTGGIAAVAWSSDLRWIVSGGEDGARIWSTLSGQCVHSLQDHTAAITSVAFSSDVRLVVTGAWDSTAKVWSVRDGKLLRTLAGHDYGVTGVAFDPSTAFIVTGSMDKTAKLWALDVSWGFVEEILPKVEQSIATVLEHTNDVDLKKHPSLDDWLDFWRDLRDASKHRKCPPDLDHRVVQALRFVRGEIEKLCETSWQLPENPNELFVHKRFRAIRVDPEFASRFVFD